MPIARRLRLAGAAALAGVLLGAAPAAAHVTVTPPTVVPGERTELTFRVPNESPTAATNRLEITLPTATPFTSVQVRATPGWTSSLRRAPLPAPVTLPGGETVTEAVAAITWSGGGIGPDEYQEFTVTVGPLPEQAGELVFPAVQTYSDGKVVRWADPAPAAGGAEPAHPVPSLRIEAPAAPEIEPAPAAGPAADRTARWIAAGALLAGLGATGLVVAGRPRPAARPAPAEPAAASGTATRDHAAV